MVERMDMESLAISTKTGQRMVPMTIMMMMMEDFCEQEDLLSISTVRSR